MIIEWLKRWWDILSHAEHNHMVLETVRYNLRVECEKRTELEQKIASLTEERNTLWQGLDTTTNVLLHIINRSTEGSQVTKPSQYVPVPRRMTFMERQQLYEVWHDKSRRSILEAQLAKEK